MVLVITTRSGDHDKKRGGAHVLIEMNANVRKEHGVKGRQAVDTDLISPRTKQNTPTPASQRERTKTITIAYILVDINNHYRNSDKCNTWRRVVTMITAMNRGFLCKPLRIFHSSKMERALSSLKIWQKTNALKRMLSAPKTERGEGGGGGKLWTAGKSRNETEACLTRKKS